MRLLSSLALLAVLVSAENKTLGPTTAPDAVTSIAPSNSTSSSATPHFVPSFRPASSAPAPTFPVATPSPRPTLGSTKAPVALGLSPILAPSSIFKPFAPISTGDAPTLSVGALTSSPAAVSLQNCAAAEQRLMACTSTKTGTCDSSCGNILASVNSDTSECEALGAICSVIHCCKVCVDETNAYADCVTNVLKCGDNQCSLSSAESNAIGVAIVFLVSVVGFGLLW